MEKFHLMLITSLVFVSLATAPQPQKTKQNKTHVYKISILPIYVLPPSLDAQRFDPINP